MQQDERILFKFDPSRNGVSDSTGNLLSSSDREAVVEALNAALDHGECERRAWRAAVGAFLERHPTTSLFTAERLVTCVVRQALDAQSPAATV